MNDIKKAIAEIKNHAEHNLKVKLSEATANIAIQALEEKIKRDKMRCENCKNYVDCENCKHYVDCESYLYCKRENLFEFPSFNKTDFCSYFKEKESEE